MQMSLRCSRISARRSCRWCDRPPRPSDLSYPTICCAEKLCRDVVSDPKAAFDSQGKTYDVTLLTSGNQATTIQCRDDEYILDAAEAAGIDLPATCRGGICGACVARVASGSVDQSDVDDLTFTLEQSQIDDGMALLCMARATSDITLETQCDWGLSLGIREWEGASGKLVGEVNPLMGQKWSDMSEEEATSKQ